jgi:shikimate kinase
VTRPILVLVGAPGSGKSTVGRLAADRLGVAFRDTDDDVEATAGKSIADLFFEDGEPAFRALERAAVDLALREHDGILSLGGGAVLDEQTRQRLKPHNVALLSVGLADATKRIGMSAARPVLALNPRAQLQQLLAERLPLYREVASIEISTDGKTPEQVLEELLLSE